jgi:hypothetical protein
MVGMEWLTFIGVAAAWLILTRIILPKLGVPT